MLDEAVVVDEPLFFFILRDYKFIKRFFNEKISYYFIIAENFSKIIVFGKFKSWDRVFIKSESNFKFK